VKAFFTIGLLSSISGGYVVNIKFKVSIAAFLTFASLLLSPLAVAANDISVPTLSVRGEAILQVPADKVTVSIGVVTESPKAKQAMQENSETMERVIESLETLGLKKKDYQTRQFNIHPIWSPRPRNADKDWKTEIIRYRVTNTLEASTKQLDLVGELINAATNAGANNIHSIQFGLSNPRQNRSEAIEQAIANARMDADTAAAASGIKIEGVHRLQVDSAPSIGPLEQSFSRRATTMAEAAAVPPVNPGDINVRASVSIEYTIAD
jgi:uncharacterized protein YggE